MTMPANVATMRPKLTHVADATLRIELLGGRMPLLHIDDLQHRMHSKSPVSPENTCNQPFNQSTIQSINRHSFVHSFVRSFVHSFVRSFVFLLIRLFVRSFVENSELPVAGYRGGAQELLLKIWCICNTNPMPVMQ